MYYVYILKSQKTGRYYVGATENIENRLKEHNNGKSKSTRPFAPYEMVYQEICQSLCDARKREKYIKSKKSRRFIDRLIGVGI